MRISSQRLYPPAFKQRIRLREEELRNSSTIDPEDKPFLKQVYRVNENTVIFDRNENSSVPGFGRILEAHLYSNGVAFTVTTKIRDLSDPKYQKDREEYLNSGAKEADLNNKAQKLSAMKNLLTGLTGRSDEGTTTGEGICIPGGFISDDENNYNDDITMTYNYGEFEIIINTNSDSWSEKTLLERNDEINPVLIRAGAHTLKKGQVVLPGINEEEWLMKGMQEIYRPEDKYVDYYFFTLYGNEKNPDNKHPLFSVKLHNSGMETKNYTDSQLVNIWDRISRTFRYHSDKT